MSENNNDIEQAEISDGVEPVKPDMSIGVVHRKIAEHEQMTEALKRNVEKKQNDIKRREIKKNIKNVKDKAEAKLKKIAEKKKRGKRGANENTVTINRLELLVTIVNRNKAEYFADLIQSFDVNMQVLAVAHGTADARMRELFGLTDNDRVVIFSVIQEYKRKSAMYVLEEKFRTIKGGKGVALALPFSSLIGAAAYGFLSNSRESVKESKDDDDKNKKV